jgi:hypothetical protein
MKAYAIAGVGALVALCGCGRGRTTQQETSSSTPKIDNSLTIAGCLIPADTTTQSGAARSSNNPPAPRFTLVDVTLPAGAAPSSVSGTSGTGGTGSVETGARSYNLVGDTKRLDDLQRFANSRVELKGLIVTSTPNVGTSSAAVGAQPSDVPLIQVQDVRQLGPTCGASKKQ